MTQHWALSWTEPSWTVYAYTPLTLTARFRLSEAASLHGVRRAPGNILLENGVLLGTFPERISEARIARHGLLAGQVTRVKDSEDLEAGS
jgi:hypothetical protein